MFVQRERVLSVVLAFLLLIMPQLLDAASYSEKTEYELGQRVRTSMLENFEPVKDRTLIDRVDHITQRIVRVADKRKGIDIEVTVIDHDVVGAWAFPGGFIFVTKPLIDLCENDDELAVVLGHEIAHEVKGHVDAPLEKRVKDQYADLLERMGVIGKGFVAEYSASDFTDEIRREKELEADGYGILYTAMAGFDVSAASPILAKLIADAGDARSRSHPSMPDREKAIQIRLRRIMDRIEVFRAGVRFYEKGQYDDAIEAFTNFLNVFPSREVYNNIGVAFHKRALLHQTQNLTLQGMKSIRIDQETLAQGIRLRGLPKETPGESPQRFRSDLRKAIQYYKQTIEQDPKYLIAYNNLGCAYDDMGDHDSADLYLRLAVAQEKNYKDAINNLGVVSMHRGKIDDAVNCFGEVLDLDPDFGPAILNMAICYESKSNIAIAQKYYKRFLSGNQLSSNKWISLAKSKSGMKDDNSSPEGSPQEVRGQLSCVSRLCLGDSVEKMVGLYGEPERKVIVLPSRNVSALVYPDVGLTALVETEKGIIGILANEKFRDHLGPNIRIGSSSIEVRHRFGAPDTIKVEAEEVMLYGYNRLGLSLRFRKDMLNEMDVYETDQL